MGLDSVEIVLEVEDAFQIHIEDEEAGKVMTVGELHEVVISKLSGVDSKRCLTSAAFYRTRRGIVDTVGIDRRQIKPSTALEKLLPRSSRRRMWKKIQESMPLKLPPLVHPGRTMVLLLLAGILLAMLPAIRLHAGIDVLGMLVLLGLALGGSLIRFTPVLAVAFPNHDATVGDLARDVLSINHAKLAAEFSSCNKKEVWEIIKKIVVEHLGVNPEKVKPEARFVDDLGMS